MEWNDLPRWESVVGCVMGCHDAERLVFYVQCMSIIVIIITPTGDWNYGYIPASYKHTNKQEKQGVKILQSFCNESWRS